MSNVYAVKPPRGNIVHLHVPGYRPSALKGRPLADRQAMCGTAIWPNGNPPLEHALVDLAEALEWTAMSPSVTDPRPVWSWCRPCIGHLVTLAGVAPNTLARCYGALTAEEVPA